MHLIAFYLITEMSKNTPQRTRPRSLRASIPTRRDCRPWRACSGSWQKETNHYLLLTRPPQVGARAYAGAENRHALHRITDNRQTAPYAFSFFVCADGGSEAARSRWRAGEERVLGRGAHADNAQPPQSCQLGRVLRAGGRETASLRVHAVRKPGEPSLW